MRKRAQQCSGGYELVAGQCVSVKQVWLRLHGALSAKVKLLYLLTPATENALPTLTLSSRSQILFRSLLCKIRSHSTLFMCVLPPKNTLLRVPMTKQTPKQLTITPTQRNQQLLAPAS
jgi:hypothetical protein